MGHSSRAFSKAIELTLSPARRCSVVVQSVNFMYPCPQNVLFGVA